MKNKLIWAVIIVIGSLIAVGFIYEVETYFLFISGKLQRWPENADVLLKVLAPFSILGAVIAALFGEYLREKIFPIDLCIATLEPHECNAVFDEFDFKDKRFEKYPEIFGKKVDVYLQVRNLTAQRPIKDCRVWLKQIEVQNAAGEWKIEDPFAVPRMMEWAPFEYSPDKRTFSTKQVFDFGLTRSDNGGFVVTIYRDQGGTFNPLFKVGKKVRFYFYATAESYQKEKVFCFEVEVPPSVQGEKVTPAKIKDCQMMN